MRPTGAEALTGDDHPHGRGPTLPAWDIRILFITRFTRLFAYGALSVILAIYLTQLGLTDAQAGLLLTLTLIGDTAVSLWLTTRADRFGRRRTLVIGAVLMALAGIVFASTRNMCALLVAGTVGVISPSGHEVGPFLSIEQATLSHVVTDRARTQLFAWYTLTGAVATALGSWSGGLISQSFVAYWFHLRFRTEPAVLGSIFFGANLFAGASALLASKLAGRIGLVKTMVFTHLPSNILLFCVPLMPNAESAVALLLVRVSISQMDVPTRQSYTMAVVRPDERSAAAGVTGVARTTGAAIAPVFAGLLFSVPSLISWPFFIAGTLKVCSDLLLYRAFVRVKPPEELG